MTNDILLTKLVDLAVINADTQKVIWETERELLANMSRDGATEFVANGHRATVSRSVFYDQGRLVPILELVPQVDLEFSGAYTPEHEETRIVAAKWNLTKLKPFSKRGHAIAEAIEDAVVLGNPTLKITWEAP